MRLRRASLSGLEPAPIDRFRSDALLTCPGSMIAVSGIGQRKGNGLSIRKAQSEPAIEMHKTQYSGQMSTKSARLTCELRLGISVGTVGALLTTARQRHGIAPKLGRIRGFGPLRNGVGDLKRDAHYSTVCRTNRGVMYSSREDAIR